MGYLLRQTVHAFSTAMESGLRRYRLTSPQYGALFVLDAEPGLSSADLARAMGTTPQAANLLVAGMEREGLVRRQPHPTHGRILEIFPTAAGARRFRAARPFVSSLDEQLARAVPPAQLGIVKGWLVESARVLSSGTRTRTAAGRQRRA